MRRLFQTRMIRWYRKESRKNLPWRKTRDPYRIWISEAMLQQTQVATVIPYYERFVSKFPTVHSLSSAPLTDVLDNWSGLGYYSRARNLHACAQTIVRDHGGRLPTEVDSLLKLPGIGRYTAGAIASIAFDRPAPILDGNVQRVLCRYLGIREDPRQAMVQRKLWQWAEELVPAKNPGDFNQAMMELGALICTPREPQCGRCPLSPDCLARRKSWQEMIPPPRRTAARKKLSYPCAVLRKKDSVLIARRPIATLLPGLWEFPGGELLPREPLLAGLRRHLANRLGIVLENPKPLASHTQILSHRELEIRAFSCTWPGKLAPPRWYTEKKWVPIRYLDQVPFTAGMAALARLLAKKAAG